MYKSLGLLEEQMPGSFIVAVDQALRENIPLLNLHPSIAYTLLQCFHKITIGPLDSKSVFRVPDDFEYRAWYMRVRQYQAMVDLYWSRDTLPEDFNMFHQWAYLESIFVLNNVNMERFLTDVTLSMQKKKFIILSGDLAVHIRRWMEKAFENIRVIHYDEEVVNAYCFCKRTVPFPIIQNLHPDVFYMKYGIFRNTFTTSPATIIPLEVPVVDCLKWIEEV